MKIYGHRDKTALGIDAVRFYVEPIKCCDVVCTIEVETPKKIVVKDAPSPCFSGGMVQKTAHFTLPYNAKNIRCTYEVEE